MEQHEWRVEFSWIKAHAGQRENEMADQLAKEAANNKNIKECYTKILNSAVLCELKNKVFSSGKMNGKDPQKEQ